MRSMLYEASTVPKAIEKAWSDSGRPEEFTIRIYEAEKRGFFGFAKRYAVVSIIFDPKKTSRKVRKPRARIAGGAQPQVPKYDPNKNIEQYLDVEKEQEKASRTQQEPYYAWSADLINCVTGSLRDLINIMGIKTKFSAKVDKHLLKIEFDRPVIEAPSEERMLFASFAYLLMQFLKRRYKKSFRSCRIAIASARR
ncbi:Jag N-terminal domain-containing protein [Candidatus Babeliales bacterium]|nr:Jag N-terminal domain-containing protein [Candidatus Babeliales bacterium]